MYSVLIKKLNLPDTEDVPDLRPNKVNTGETPIDSSIHDPKNTPPAITIAMYQPSTSNRNAASNKTFLFDMLITVSVRNLSQKKTLSQDIATRIFFAHPLCCTP